MRYILYQLTKYLEISVSLTNMQALYRIKILILCNTWCNISLTFCFYYSYICKYYNLEYSNLQAILFLFLFTVLKVRDLLISLINTKLHFILIFLWILISSVQSLSRVQLFVTPRAAARQASLSITNSWSLFKLISLESVMPSNHLILCRPLLLPPSIFPSIRVFLNESVLHIRWPKYCFSFNISSSNEHSGLISFRMDWLDLLAVQGTLKSLLQHQSSKASILWCLTFFIVQLSHPYMTTGKTIALTRWSFVGKAMSLLFNMLSRLIIAFLLRSKRLLISWLQSPSAVILEPQN